MHVSKKRAKSDTTVKPEINPIPKIDVVSKVEALREAKNEDLPLKEVALSSEDSSPANPRDNSRMKAGSRHRKLMGLNVAFSSDEDEATYKREMLQMHLINLFGAPEGLTKKVKLRDVENEIVELLKSNDPVMLLVCRIAYPLWFLAVYSIFNPYDRYTLHSSAWE